MSLINSGTKEAKEKIISLLGEADAEDRRAIRHVFESEEGKRVMEFLYKKIFYSTDNSAETDPYRIVFMNGKMSVLKDIFKYLDFDEVSFIRSCESKNAEFFDLMERSILIAEKQKQSASTLFKVLGE